ncbi:hypothetical protein BGW37DRAFT_486248 [Umbelopsis sp. PMI_123]|nr:hypothetical protein BGW37DRAFT_486248 [Umbelopsis sp. PMI_123]
MSVQGFWGLQVEPENTYTQVVDASFRVTMAALGENLIGVGRTCVKVVVDDKEFVLCSLSPDKHEQQTLDHTFVEGEEVTFLATGKNCVHLTGNYVPDQEEAEDEMEIPPELAALAARMRAAEQGVDMDGDEDTEAIDANPLTKLLNPTSEVLESDEEDDDYEDGDSDEEEEDDDEEDIVDAEIAKTVANAIDEDEEESNSASDEEESNEDDDDEDEEEDDDEEEDEEEIDEMELERQILSKNKRSGKQVANPPESKKRKAEAKAKATTGSIRSLSNGMTIEDLKLGQGEKAKAGKRVSMRYFGKLENGKVFDKNVTGAPFTFALGRGEVIKGWDIGIAGMQIGGERKLTIPAPLAYGKQGSPPVIPPNATLTFTVKLLAIK